MRSTLSSAKKQKQDPSKDPLKYPCCPLHKTQPLNLLCLSPSCKSQPLLCTLCKPTHSKHQTRPLKLFLKSFEDYSHSLKPTTTSTTPPATPHYVLAKINEMYQNVLVTLRETVDKLANSVREFEIELVKDFNRVSDELEEENGRAREVVECLEKIKGGVAEEFEGSVKKLLSCVKYDPLKKTIDVVNIPQQYLIEYSQKQHNYIQTIKQLHFSTLLTLSSANPNHNPTQPKRPFYKFDQALKPTIIKLSQNNLSARQTQSNNGDLRFALIQPPLPTDKPSQITFHIKNKTNWVGLGIALKPQILAKKFKFNYSTTGHGSFLLSTNGYTWSHSRAEDNIKLKAFTFDTGTNVKVVFDPVGDRVVYTNLDDDREYEQVLGLSEGDRAGGIGFCANLGSHGDEIKIINVKSF